MGPLEACRAGFHAESKQGGLEEAIQPCRASVFSTGKWEPEDGQDNHFTTIRIPNSWPGPEPTARHTVNGRASSVPRVSKASSLGLWEPLPSPSALFPA